MNIGFYFTWTIPRSGNAGLYGIFMFDFIKKLHLPVFYVAFEKSDGRRFFSLIISLDGAFFVCLF